MAPRAVPFWERVDTSAGPYACWPWLGCRSKEGYGNLKQGGRARRATHVALGLTEPGVLVMHTCDHPPCCNPSHLVVGSDAQNARDKVRKGRAVNKLSPSDREAIRAAYAAGGVTMKQLGAAYGVCYQAIQRVIWRGGVS